MSYLLDTNVISELRKARIGRCDAMVARWIAGVKPSAMFLSALTVYELERGALLMGRRDPAQGAALLRWLDGQLSETFRDRILVLDTTIAKRCAALNVPDPRPLTDSLIAATALVHGMTVVTRNVADFERMGVVLINPWEA